MLLGIVLLGGGFGWRLIDLWRGEFGGRGGEIWRTFGSLIHRRPLATFGVCFN